MMTNERCRLISESQWREYQECVQKMHRLEKQLDVSTKALQYYAEGTLGSSVAQKALKEMEEV